jgi:hypothetical protein
MKRSLSSVVKNVINSRVMPGDALKGEVPAFALQWQDVGPNWPSEGRQLINSRLSDALAVKTQFTEKEWDAFCMPSPRINEQTCLFYERLVATLISCPCVRSTLWLSIPSRLGRRIRDTHNRPVSVYVSVCVCVCVSARPPSGRPRLPEMPGHACQLSLPTNVVQFLQRYQAAKGSAPAALA